MKVRVENERCEAHGQCWMVDEELFPLDDDGYSAIPAGGTVVPPGKDDVAHRGVDSCPLQALHVE